MTLRAGHDARPRRAAVDETAGESSRASEEPAPSAAAPTRDAGARGARSRPASRRAAPSRPSEPDYKDQWLRARRPTSRTSASARAATSAPPRRAASPSSPRELLPALDNLERALAAAEAQPENRDHHLTDGIRLVQSELLGALARVGIEPDSPMGEPFDPAPPRGDRPAARRRRRGGHDRRGLQRRLPPTATTCCGPPGRRGRLGGRRGPARPLQRPRRRQEGVAGRDQEGLPQARAPVPPRPQPGRQAGRGALQGDLGGLRRPRRPGQAQAVRPRRHVRRRRRPGRRRPGRLRRAAPSRDILSNLFGGGGGGGGAGRTGARGPRAERGARPRGRGLDLLRPGHRRRAGPAHRPDLAALRHLPRHRRQARHAPKVCPRCQGRGIESAGPGPVLDLPAVLALRRHRAPSSRTRARPATARARCARSRSTA